MEDFLREKLSHSQPDFENDWSDFEQKLDRALFFKQMRVGALVSVVLIMLSIAFFGGTSFLKLGQSTASQFEKQVLKYYGTGSYTSFGDEDAAVAYQEVEEQTSALYNEGTEDKLTAEKPEIAPVKTLAVVAGTEVAESQKISNKASPKEDESKAEIQASLAGTSLSRASGSTEASFQVVQGVKPIAESNITEDGSVGEGVANEPSFTEEKVVLATKSSGYRTSGFSLIPDGKSSSNYKPNNRPTALLFDMSNVKELKLREPIVPVNLRPSKPTEAYVSPLQEVNPWSYSIKVYPNFTYRKFVVAPNKMQYIHRDFVDQVEISETGGFSLNVGFEASKRIGLITYLNAGVEYISYKTEANFDFTNYRDAVINSATGEIQSYHLRSEPEQVVISDVNRYHYLNFPVSIAYKPWATDHVRMNIEAGASYMYFVTASGKSIDYQTLEIIDISERDYRNSMASVFMKLGVNYHVSSKFSLGFEPTVVYFTNTIYTEEYPFEVIPYSVGVNFKLQMKLN